MTHGYPKLFGQNPEGHSVMVPPSGSMIYIAGVIELFGGALVLIGLFTRAAALLLTADMAWTAWKLGELGGYLATKRYELPLILCVASFALATVGPGVFSIDHPLFSSAPKRKTAKK